MPNATTQLEKDHQNQYKHDGPECHGKVVTEPNVVMNSLPFNDTARLNPSKSVVVSNVGKDFTMDYVKKYLVDKLGIQKVMINLSLLLPTARTVQDVNFLQYNNPRHQFYRYCLLMA